MMQRTPGGNGVTVALLLAVVAGLTVAGAAAVAETGAETPTGEEVINDTLDRYANAESVVGTVAVSGTASAGNASATVDFAVAGNQSRVVVTADGRTYRAGTTGTVAWFDGPNRSVAYDHETLQRLAERRNATLPTALLNRTVENVTVEGVVTATEDDVPAYAVDLSMESDDRQATVWVAQSDARLLRMKATDGTNRTVVDYRQTRFNVSVHDSTFDPPTERRSATDAERYDRFAAAQANTSLDLPALNATFHGAGVITRGGGTAVAQQYVAGGDDVTVLSTTLDREFAGGNGTAVTVNGQAATVTTLRERAVVYWERDGVTTALTVAGDEERALDLADRLD
jgi:outer membrane lipoprotein-sorting protein